MDSTAKPIDWMDHVFDGIDKDPYYPLISIEEKFEVVNLCKDGWLILNKKDDLWLDFAVMDFGFSDVDNKNIHLSCICHGGGPIGNLRECRHTWWGQEGDGYLFYPNGKVITAAFKVLSEFYDRMV